MSVERNDSAAGVINQPTISVLKAQSAEGGFLCCFGGKHVVEGGGGGQGCCLD